MSDGTKIKIIFEIEDAKLDGAEFKNSLSFVGDNQATGDFTSTLDRLVFEKLTDIFTKVLEAKGFALNVENYLAVIDQTRIGIYAHIEESEHPPYEVNEYSYCLKVPAPSKRAQGVLLEKFYQEIKSYEQQILKLKEDNDQIVSQKKTQTVGELRDEVKILKNRIETQKEEIKILNERLERALSQVGFSDQQIQNMPDLSEGSFRVVRVSDHKLREGKIYLKSKNTSFSYPVVKLNVMPLIGAKCMAFVQEGVVTDLYPCDDKVEDFELYVAEVLDVSPSTIKVRDSARNLLTLKSDFTIHARLKIGDKLLVSKYREKVIKWKMLKTPKQVREKIIDEENYQYQLINKAA
ncbi:MAG: hypothetical protein H6621_07690 [Halobacteriovoraceae bacterium]|nr:hypothetical protein [Halobacteriovoraceae bacterium]